MPTTAPARPASRVPHPDEKSAYVRTMFARIAGRYDLLNDLMTAGRHRHWKRVAARAIRLDLPLASGLGVALASAVINHLAIGSGAGAFAVRMHLLARIGVPSAQSLSIMSLQTAASNVALATVTGLGLVLMVQSGSLAPVEVALSLFAILVIISMTTLVLVALFHPRLRKEMCRRQHAAHVIDGRRA